MTRIHKLEAITHLEQRIQHFEIALPRHAESKICTVNEKLIHENSTAAAGVGFGFGGNGRSAFLNCHAAILALRFACGNAAAQQRKPPA